MTLGKMIYDSEPPHEDDLDSWRVLSTMGREVEFALNEKGKKKFMNPDIQYDDHWVDCTPRNTNMNGTWNNKGYVKFRFCKEGHNYNGKLNPH